MTNTKPKRYPYTITFRCTMGEAAGLSELAHRHAAKATEAGFDSDGSVAAYLRSLLRREAKATGVDISEETSYPEEDLVMAPDVQIPEKVLRKQELSNERARSSKAAYDAATPEERAAGTWGKKAPSKTAPKKKARG